MRIVELIPSVDVGGAERLVALLARELGRSGHTVTVVSLYPATGSWIEGELVGAGVAVRFLGKRPGPDPRVVPRLARALDDMSPEVIHTHLHTLPYALLARAASRSVAACSIAHTLHNVAEHESPWYGRLLHGAAFRSGVEPVAIGAAVADSVRQVYGVTPRHTIPNGIPLAECRAAPGARERVRASLALPPSAPVFLAVGRLSPQKDHATLVDAFAAPALRALDARLVVAGEGPLRAALEQRVEAHGLGGRVRFLGLRADVPDLLAAADVFVLPSRWEGNPLVVMEAMAAGRPVIATAVGCVPELVSDAVGRRVPAGDAAAMAAAMRDLAVDRPLREGLGAAAQAVAQARFDIATMAHAYGALFATLGSPGTTSPNMGGIRRSMTYIHW